MNFYDFKVKDRLDKELDLNTLKGKVVLVVNTATECGFTPTYSELQSLYEELHDKGLEILDFPCNQFGAQAPGSNDEIHTFCETRFGITFPQMKKIEVNGENAEPLYKFLKSEKGFAHFDEEHKLTPVLKKILSEVDKDYEKSSDIKWNFTKFLIGKNGEVVRRFEPTTSIEVVKKAVLDELSK